MCLSHTPPPPVAVNIMPSSNLDNTGAGARFSSTIRSFSAVVHRHRRSGPHRIATVVSFAHLFANRSSTLSLDRAQSRKAALTWGIRFNRCSSTLSRLLPDSKMPNVIGYLGSELHCAAPSLVGKRLLKSLRESFAGSLTAAQAYHAALFERLLRSKPTVRKSLTLPDVEFGRFCPLTGANVSC